MCKSKKEKEKDNMLNNKEKKLIECAECINIQVDRTISKNSGETVRKLK